MRRMIAVFTAMSALVGWTVRAAEPVSEPKHLQEAQVLVRGLKLEDTHYNHGEPDVQWKGVNGATKFVSHTDCSGFVNSLLIHTYDYKCDDFRKWFGKNRPMADNYHDAIAQQKGFAQVLEFKDTRPGDILAIKYFTKKSDTGHVMLAAGVPRKIALKKPVIGDTEQWEITVIDSSKTGHGPTDTRHKNGENGKDHTWLGEGVLRVYTQPDRKTWLSAGSSWDSNRRFCKGFAGNRVA